MSTMRKRFTLICAMGAALVLAGCQKENGIEPAIEETTHSIVFTAEKIIDTKTAIDAESSTEVSYKWIEGDDARMRITESYQYDENGVTKTGTHVGTITSMNITNEGKKATFNVTFSGTAPESEVTYQASYAGSHSGSGNPLIPAAQSPLPTTFDPAADVLVSDPIVKDARDPENNEFIFDMTRKVSVNKMTLKGLEEGEVISSVTFESDKQHSAYYAIATGNYSANSKKLTFTFTDNNTVPASGEFPVYFTTAPVDDATFTVTVTTDKNVYTKTSGSKITFACGTFKRFGVNLSGYGEPITEGTVYTLVESQSDLFDGATYIVVAAKDDSYYALGSQATNNRSGVAIPSPVDNTITIDNTTIPFPVSINSCGTNWYINDNYASSDNYGNFIYNASTSGSSPKSYLRSEEDADAGQKAEWTISISDGIASINNVGNTDRGCLVMNYNNGSPLFNVYASVGSYSTLALYVDLTTCVVLADPELSFSPASKNVNWDDKESFVKPTLDNPHSVTVSYSSSNEDVATVDANNGDITFVGNGTTTITASSAKTAEYKAGTAQYTITVTGAPEKGSAENPYTASEAAALALGGDTSEGVYVKGIISSIYGSGYNSSTQKISFFISDDGLTTSTQFEIYSVTATSANDYLAGDAVTFQGTLTKYNSTPEFAAGSTCIAQLHAPSFTPDGGSFSGDSQSVTITADSGAEIRYTLDETTPTATTGSVYSSAIVLSATTTIKAIAVKDGVVTGLISKTFTKTSGEDKEAVYVFNTDAGLAALGITKPATSDGTNLGTSAYISGDVSMVTTTATGATATRVWNSNGSTDLRIYKSSTLTFSIASGSIKSIVLAGNTVNGFTANVGTYNNGTWTGSASSVTFTATGTERINTITITYN